MSAGEIQVSKSSSDDLESGSLDTVRDCLSFDSQVHHTANVGINKGGRDGCNGSKQMLRSAWKQKPSGEDQAGTTTNRGPQDKKCSSSDVFAHAPMYTSSYEKFERKLMDNIHLGPILVISIILIRLGLLHVLNQSFHHDDEAFIAAYNIICVLCFLCVWGSVVLNSFQNRTVLSKVKGDNAVMVSVCVGFSLLLVLMSMHDLQASDDDHQGRIFDGDAGFSLYHEMLVYVLAVPVMLQIALSHLTLYGMVLGWTPCLAAVLAMLFIVDLPHHSNLTTPFVIALVSKSLLLMLYIRKQRTSLLRMYTQLEDMKSSHNELIDELEGKKQEMVEQRHMIANIAHDLKTPVAATLNGCTIIADVMKNLLSDSKKDTEDGKASNLSMSTSSILDGIELTQSTLHDINNTNKFMLIAINRCLDYAKTADGLKLIPKYETCHLTECVQTALNCLSSVADKKKVHIANIPEVICSHVITDKQWLQENILCLLTNAVKFTPRGVVDIRIRLIGDHHKGANGTNSEPSSIRSGIIRKSFSFGSAVDSKSFLRIEVEDQGIGIVKDMQQKLFAPFSQAQKHAGGTGLGLYSLSKRIEAIGGECGVRDRLDSRQGSLFWFTVPYKPDEITSAMMKLDALDDMSEVWMANFPAHPHHPINQKQDIRHSPSVLGNKPSRAHQRSNAGSLLFTNITMSSIATQCLFEKGGETNTQQEVSTPRSLMILLVDDSIPILKMTSKLLERQGHVVVCAENGLEALHHLEENKHKFDVMITDLQMPVMDGLEVIRRVTASDSCHHKEIQKELVKSKHIPPVARISNPLTSEKTIDTRKVYIADDIKDEHNPSHLIAVTRKKRMWIIASCGLDDDETIEETLRAGADAYLSKPFSMQQFHQVMLKLEHEYLSSSSP